MSIMQNELCQAPFVVNSAIENCRKIANDISILCKKRKVKNIIVAGRGSSLNAGIGFKFFVEAFSNFNVSFEYPSLVTLFNIERNLNDTLYVVISQSGQSNDTIKLTKSAIKSGAIVVSVTNNNQSPVSKLSHFNLNICAGKEEAIAATKTFTGQLVALQILSDKLNNINSFQNFDLTLIDDILSNSIPKLQKPITTSQNAIILSRGYTEVVAKECALKLMETCYMFTYASSTNEFQHGPKALITFKTPVILFAPSTNCIQDFIDCAKDLKSKGAYLIIFSDNNKFINLANLYIQMPKIDDVNTALLYTIKMQQFVATLCKEKGLSPDKPRNLNKVTITN